MTAYQSDSDFLSQLQAQAAKQSKLEKHRFFPSKFDGITSFIGNYPWQFILCVSGGVAAILLLLQ